MKLILSLRKSNLKIRLQLFLFAKLWIFFITGFWISRRSVFSKVYIHTHTHTYSFPPKSPLNWVANNKKLERLFSCSYFKATYWSSFLQCRQIFKRASCHIWRVKPADVNHSFSYQRNMEMLASNQSLGVFPKRKESFDIIRKMSEVYDTATLPSVPKLMVARASIHLPLHNTLKLRTINHSIAAVVTGAG